jgi:hypothetical protein
MGGPFHRTTQMASDLSDFERWMKVLIVIVISDGTTVIKVTIR